MNTIRPIRSYLRKMRDEKQIDASIYRKYYMKSKGGEFRSKHHLESRLISDGIIKEAKK